MSDFSSKLRWQSLMAVLSSILFSAGCDVRIASFEANQIFAKRLEITESVEMAGPVADASVVLKEMFGTPDEPRWPAQLNAVDEALGARLSEGQQSNEGEVSSGALVSLERLQRAAGAVRSDEMGKHWGLFREHCVVCHGVSGDGLGPTASLLNPYPRNFTLGKFKFKSTPIGEKPTHADLKVVLKRGIVGTSMPSFALLDEEDLDALVDYVIYLSVRGEVERRLLSEAAMELDFERGERLYDPELADADPIAFEQQWASLRQIADAVVSNWAEANDAKTVIDGPPEDIPMFGDEGDEDGFQDRLMASIANGKKLFQGNVASCAFCHGPEAQGDGQQNNYDDWTRDWTSMAGLDPKNKQQLAPMLALGALKPRNILPRNLTLGHFRGGSRPEDLYLRIVNGIEGTPMPAAPLKPSNPQGLAEREVWDIVNFLLSLQGGLAAEAGAFDE